MRTAPRFAAATPVFPAWRIHGSGATSVCAACHGGTFRCSRQPLPPRLWGIHIAPHMRPCSPRGLSHALDAFVLVTAPRSSLPMERSGFLRFSTRPRLKATCCTTRPRDVRTLMRISTFHTGRTPEALSLGRTQLYLACANALTPKPTSVACALPLRSLSRHVLRARTSVSSTRIASLRGWRLESGRQSCISILPDVSTKS